MKGSSTVEDFLELIYQIKYDYNTVDIDHVWQEVAKKLDAVLSKIEQCKNLKEAEMYFVFLALVQSVFAIPVFEGHVGVSPYMKIFMRDFDRTDDLAHRERIFKEIQSGEYQRKLLI